MTENENDDNEIKEPLLVDKIQNNEKDSKEEIKDGKEYEEKEISLQVYEGKDNDNDNEIENKDLNQSFGQVIEDDIKRNDTAEFMLKKKKTEEENEEYKTDDYFSKKGKLKIKFQFHMKINKKFLRYSTFILIILYVIITVLSCVRFHNRREDYPFLFIFKFIERTPKQMQDKAEKDIIYFLTDLNSFYILHIVLLVIFISVCILLIKGPKQEIDYFFNNMSIFFDLTLIFNIPILLNGMFTEVFYGSHLQSTIYLILSLFSFLFMLKIYLVTKSHKYKSIRSYINISVLSSLLMAYHCYCFLFTINYFIMNFYKPEIGEDKEYPAIEITLSSLYFAIGIVVITVFKDIFFCVSMVNLEIGLLYIKRQSEYVLTTTIVNIAILSLNYASIIIIIFAFNKNVFMIKDKKK